MLDVPIPESTAKQITREEQDTLNKWREDDLTARSYMLVSMSNKLPRQHEKMVDAHTMLTHL